MWVHLLEAISGGVAAIGVVALVYPLGGIAAG